MFRSISYRRLWSWKKGNSYCDTTGRGGSAAHILTEEKKIKYKNGGKIMTFDCVNPLTGKVKEYKNSAEWWKDVEKAHPTPKPEPVKKDITYLEAMARLKKEAGITF